LLFTFRAIGILSGMATNLDPNFDPWGAAIPFAERLAQEELHKNWRGWLEAALDLGRLTLKLPARIDRVLTEIEQGNLVVQNALAPNTRKAIKNLEQAVNRLTWIVLAVGLLISGVILYGYEAGGRPALWLVGAALVVLVWGLLRER
jgi:predicted unusual protein kinase regulating ubiquinone biosynthesis (AarF/ABC1/UbiB family)